MTLVDPADLDPADAKAHAALGRYRLERVAAPGPAFDEAWGALDAEFGPRGEIERRPSVLNMLAWSGRRLSALDDGRELLWDYHLLAARDEHGALAGARDCHVTVDGLAGECVVYLAHTLVLPAHRRAGLASLFRAAPVTIGRRAARGGDVLLAAEMEPWDPQAEDTLVRLIAYGRAGFRVVPPAALPYCQPDFRDLDALGAAARPIPLLSVVRWLGHDDDATLPARLCRAYQRHIYAIFAMHCRSADLEPAMRHALEALARAGDDIPLLPLPRSKDDEALRPLERPAVLAHHIYR
jgi:hypothetical protein